VWVRKRTESEDWSLAHYAEILETVLEDRPVFPFSQLDEARAEPRAALWRHDVEVSLSGALEMAALDHQLGVSATFFLLISSEYNVFEREQANVIDKIRCLGHDLGLHYDVGLLNERGVFNPDLLLLQIDLLARYFGAKISAMSAHLPLFSDILPDMLKEHGVVDAYSLSDFRYVSDSGQLWRGAMPTEMLQQEQKLQVLIHPDYWSREGYEVGARLFVDTKTRFDESWQRTNEWLGRMRSRLRLRQRADEDFGRKLKNTYGAE
jgi:hypothetical protein